MTVTNLRFDPFIHLNRFTVSQSDRFKRRRSPELGFDVAGTGGARLDLLLLLLPQDPLRQQVVGGCDVVVLVGLQGSGTTLSHERVFREQSLAKSCNWTRVS